MPHPRRSINLAWRRRRPHRAAHRGADSAYGVDETFNAVGLAVALSRRDYYNLDRMLKAFLRHGGQIACCGTRLHARGLTAEYLIDNAARSTMEQPAAWTVVADDVLTF